MATTAKHNGSSIPLFNLPPSPSSPSPHLATSLTRAAHEYGFLYIRTPLLSSSLVANMFSLSSSFFSLPSTQKSRHPMQPNNRGFTGLRGELLDPSTQSEGDPKEAFNFGEFSAQGQAEQPLPETFAAAEPEIAEFQRRCREICLQMLELIAEGLSIETTSKGEDGREWFASRHDPQRGPSGTILRLLHYPASTYAPSKEKRLRAGAHSDYGSLTLLFRQKGDQGLEIQPPRFDHPSLSQGSNDEEKRDSEDEWLPVPIFPPGTESDPSPPVLVNIGDLLSYWTGGWLRSTVHRVTFSDSASERYSIAYFCHPIRSTQLVPVPSAIIRDHVRSNRGSDTEPEDGEEEVLTATGHLHARLRATYGWKGEVDTA